MWLEQPLPVGPPTQAAVGTAGRHLLFKSLLLGGGGTLPRGSSPGSDGRHRPSERLSVSGEVACGLFTPPLKEDARQTHSGSSMWKEPAIFTRITLRRTMKSRPRNAGAEGRDSGPPAPTERADSGGRKGARAVPAAPRPCSCPARPPVRRALPGRGRGLLAFIKPGRGPSCRAVGAGRPPVALKCLC